MLFTRKHIFSLLLLLLFSSPIILFSQAAKPVQADATLVTGQTGLNDVAIVFGNPVKDPRYLAVRVISIALGFVAVIFLGLTIFAGFKYMTAGGNQEKTLEALKLLRNAIIGLVIVLSSWMVTRFVIIMLNRAVKDQPLTLPPVGM